LYEEAAQVSWDLKDYADYRAALDGLGVLELEAGALGAAEEAFRRALRSAVDDDHGGDQARAKMNIGICYQDLGTDQAYEAAEAEYLEALPLAVAWGEPELLGDVLFNLAQLLFYFMGRPREARTRAVSAAEAYGRAGSAKETLAWDLISKIDNG
jgi:tetratricopeptide (TPR) repeat protein